MAEVKYLADINLNKNQITNVTLQHIAGNPSGSVEAYEGRAFYDSTNKVIKFHNGTTFVALSAATGDITSVVAGAGMTGGGDAGGVTLNVVGGAGITASANEILLTNGLIADGSNITSVGTIGAGVWEGTTIKTAYIGNDQVTEDKLSNALLAEIDANTAKATNVSTNLGITGDAEARVITSSDGNNVTIPVATTSVSGLMNPTRFDMITANNAKNTNVTQTSVSGASGTVTSIGNLTGDVTSTNRATVIGTGKVTMAKIADIATDTFIGRTASGDGVPKALSKSEALAILNVVDGANVNVATNLGITGDAAARVITSSTGNNATIPVATTSVSGLLTPGLFDEIDANTAKSTNVVTNLSIANGTGARTIASSDGTNAVIPVATTSVSGVMSTAIFDKVTLNTAKETNTDVDVNNANLLTRLAALQSAGGAADQDIVIGTDSGDTLVITGNLQVDGTTTTINTETVSTTDNNIVLASGNTSGAVVNATGLTFEGGSGDDVTLQWLASATALELKVGSDYAAFKAGTITGSFSGNVTGNASGSAGTVTTIGNLTGDVTSSNRATTIAADAVTYAKMQNLAAGNRVLGATSAGVIGEVQIVEAMIADDAVTADKLANAINSAIAANTSKATNVSTNLTATTHASQITLNSSDGNNVVVAQASGSIAGVMTVAHHDKLDGIETSATADQSKGDIDGLAITTVGTLDTGNATAIVSDASVSVKGKVELATTTEALAGSDTARAVTPAGLAARSYRALLGDGSATAITVDHGLNTRDLVVQLYDASSFETVHAQVVRTTAARVTVTFNVAPTNEDIVILITKID